jgi:hypothetical protein
MKKLIALVITLMTIVTLSASAQCLTAVHISNSTIPPQIYGDMTACPKTTGTYEIKTAALNAVSYRWYVPKGWGITDGSNANQQLQNNSQYFFKPRNNEYYQTDSLRVIVAVGNYGGTISVYPVNSCGQVGQPLTATVNMTCTSGWGITVPTVTVLPDTTFVPNTGLNIKPDPAYRTAGTIVTCIYLSSLPSYNGVTVTSWRAWRKSAQGTSGEQIYKYGFWWSPLSYEYFGSLPYCYSNMGWTTLTPYQSGQDFDLILTMTYGNPASYVQCSTPFVLDCQDPIDTNNP